MPQFSIPQPQLSALCRNFRVQQMHLFGSAITGEFNPQTSDVNVLVVLLPASPVEQGETLMNLWDELESLFGRKVDLLTYNSVRNPYLLAEINRTKKLVYDATGAQVSV